MKLRSLLLLPFLALLMTACNENPAWDGPSPNGKADMLASETCKCLYEMVGKEPGWDLEAIMKEMKSLRKRVKGDLGMAVLGTADPKVIAALQGEEEFSMKMDDCECMKPVQDGLLQQGVAFEEMMARLDMHCLLGPFYN